MYILLSYFSDGSGQPLLQFFTEGNHEKAIVALIKELEAIKTITFCQITDLTSMPIFYKRASGIKD